MQGIRSNAPRRVARTFPDLRFTHRLLALAVTEHIPDKGAQTVKYYGYYSNKSRGQRAKIAGRAGPPGPPPPAGEADPKGVVQSQIESRVRETPKGQGGNQQSKIPQKIPSRTWRELIKKVWSVDPLLCPKCGDQMRLIALIEEDHVIEEILRHLDLWEGPSRPTGRAPPAPFRLEYTHEPFYDDIPFGVDSFAQ